MVLSQQHFSLTIAGIDTATVFTVADNVTFAPGIALPS